LRPLLAGMRRRQAAALRVPLALGRFVVVDLETTGLRANRDRIIEIGAVSVCARSLRHDDCFERILRQSVPSATDNILVHRIGHQAQRSGEDPATVLVDFLEYVGDSIMLAFRAEFDATLLRREWLEVMSFAPPIQMIDLATVLPALIPGTSNDTLDEWAAMLGVAASERHRAIGDAYQAATLLLVVLERATRLGLHTTADLLGVERAHAWLGSQHFRA
jgi:DNA polymerase-3 subunit epsilon